VGQSHDVGGETEERDGEHGTYGEARCWGTRVPDGSLAGTHLSIQPPALLRWERLHCQLFPSMCTLLSGVGKGEQFVANA
jgi:hypothetical protein